MRNFDYWFRRTSRKATAQMWVGMGLMLLAVLVAYWLRSVFSNGGDLVQGLFSTFRWIAAVPFLTGALLAAQGSWCIWRLYREPEGLYVDHNGRVR